MKISDISNASQIATLLALLTDSEADNAPAALCGWGLWIHSH